MVESSSISPLTSLHRPPSNSVAIAAFPMVVALADPHPIHCSGMGARRSPTANGTFQTPLALPDRHPIHQSGVDGSRRPGRCQVVSASSHLNISRSHPMSPMFVGVL
ncbi:hypothetical protein D1007_06868 [Hordeum vulgare]|uniref:Predicted protein n=1 Tax=Hordeum vulgare subsp. vulgare TaxID=112509 RepID=F2EFS8_HORVV|nr:hypothetical protein D1007_06868 [Hordeum vulgare]BAK06200.1 predicted protein [Hordeum vulgare subsp. vulgare]